MMQMYSHTVINYDINSLYSHLILSFDTVYTMECSKINYRHFLRINNRKKYQLSRHIDRAGYPCVTVRWQADIVDFKDCDRWLKENCKPGSYLSAPYGVNRVYWFAYDNDALMFRLAWGND